MQQRAEADGTGSTSLVCYALHDHVPKLVPARVQRQWMDEFSDPAIYQCLPMSIANAFGWDLLCPVPIEISWNGGPAVTDLAIKALKPLPGGGPVRYFCQSHFSGGIATMHVDYIFRTAPGWNLLATGPFNSPKGNAYPLTGIIDTDRLSYPFTMNWQVLRQGQIRFEEDGALLFDLSGPHRHSGGVHAGHTANFRRPRYQAQV